MLITLSLLRYYPNFEIGVIDGYNYPNTSPSLHWRHNKPDGVSNHQPWDCLLNSSFRCRPKKTSKLRVTGLCAENSPGTGEFSAQKVSNAENVFIWWRHYVRMKKWTASLPPNSDIAFYACNMFLLTIWTQSSQHGIMTSSNGNVFRFTGHLCEEFTGHWWGSDSDSVYFIHKVTIWHISSATSIEAPKSDLILIPPEIFIQLFIHRVGAEWVVCVSRLE